MDKVCYIVGNGEFNSSAFDPKENDFVIAADGGIKYTNGRENLIISDFDSSNEIVSNQTITLPSEKDDTDLAYALKYAMSLGYTHFKLNGVLGGKRLSHTVGNIQLLCFLRNNGCYGELFGIDKKCYLIDRVKEYPAGCVGYISIFALCDSIVTLKGLKYPLTDYSLTPDYPLGVSNEFTEKHAFVCVKEGLVLAIEENYD